MSKFSILEDIKRVNPYGCDYWLARELYPLLGYTEFTKFIRAVSRAKEACVNSGQIIEEHFHDIQITLKSTNQWGEIDGRTVSDIELSRYACYLIAQNGDPRKEEVALAQTYFALQTRRQEMHQDRLEDASRVMLRADVVEQNKKLSSTAKKAGVKNFAVFQDYGYMGLYGGMRQRDIHKKKKLKKNQAILDHMSSEEMAANWFRITQADARIKRETIIGEEKANKTHFEVGKKVRQTIKELGGTMPENLPAVESVKESKKRLRKPVNKLLLL